MPIELSPKLHRKRVLKVAFHFPPLSGSSGIQRTLGFARHLPEFGWDPVVLAPSPRAYPAVDNKQLLLIPDGLEVERSFCLDTARHLAIRGRYLNWLAVPDRWVSWVAGAFVTGMKSIKKHQPDAIWSTYPIASSHIIGNILSKRSGIPWIADFRDPMVERDSKTGEYTPSDSSLRQSRLKIERSCAKNASALVFCTAQARDICLNRYPDLDPEKCHVISNGYDEWSFAQAEKTLDQAGTQEPTEPLTLLHSGTIYPTPDRDPGPFFDAVAALKQRGIVSASTLQIILRATGHDGQMRRLLDERKIEDIVQLAPSLPYIDALAEMMVVDGLLVFQGYTSNPAIPAKLYEYLRAGTPIFALVDAAGSTAHLLKDLRAGTMVTIEDSTAIEHALPVFLENTRNGNHAALPADQKGQFSRAELTRQLARLFDAATQ